jgi:aminopeptidase N
MKAKIAATVAVTGLLGYGIYRYVSYLKQAKQKQKDFNQIPTDTSHLRKEEAESRANSIHNIKYSLLMALSTDPYYYGINIITFQISEQLTRPLFIEYSGKAITYISINDKIYDLSIFRNGRIYFPMYSLGIGRNVIEIRFSNSYSNNGYGFHRFVDPTDNRIYSYTHFEPYYAHYAYPCFDQPDMKATFVISAIAPSHWQVVSNDTINQTVEYSQIETTLNKMSFAYSSVKDAIKIDSFLIQFHETPVNSTYISALIAGDYKCIENESIESSKYPMKIYIRQSMYPRIQCLYPDLFSMLSAGMQFYEKYFDFSFPYRKHDHVFCPEYKIGAMENIGVVTINESYLGDEELTKTQLTALNVVMLHELSHSWFGDLVTMKWWSDLWLKESFATYMMYLSYEAISNSTEETYIRSHFYNRKERGYIEDQYPTTHPIVADCKNTEDSQNVFDAITYNKGCSVLKQLSYYLEGEAFQKGVQMYISKYKWSNTTLSNFIGCLQDACKSNKKTSMINVSEWAYQWIQKKGFNILSYSFEAKGQNIAQFTISQRPSPHGEKINRSHKIDISFFDKNFHETLYKGITIEASEVSVISSFKGAEVPCAVFLNSTDMDYCGIEFSEMSYVHLKSGFKYLNILQQKLFLHFMMESVSCRRSLRINTIEAIRDMLMFLKGEVVWDIFLAIHVKLIELCNNYLEATQSREMCYEVFEFYISNPRYAKNIAPFISSKSSVVKMLSIINNKEMPLANISGIICAINASDECIPDADKTKLIESYYEAISGQDKLISQAMITASANSHKEKYKVWMELINCDSSVSYKVYEAKMRGFWQKAHMHIMKHYITQFFKEVRE